MSNIVFFCIPAHGHTNPTLGVVRELTDRGHKVWYYSYNVMREKIEAAGATFISCDDYDMEQMQPDCIVADSMAIWGKAVAMKLHIPFVSSTTTFAFNQYSAKIMKRSAGEVFRMLFSMPKINRDIKRLQDKGYPVKQVLDILQNDEHTHTIVYTSPEFQPCADTFSEKYAFVGPSIRPVTGDIEKKRKTLVYISMGTVNNDLLPLYKRFLDAFAKTDYQVILSVGNLVPTDAFGELPEHICVFPSVDQIAVLKKADVFLSHCGMNSVNESLYFGVPLVMLPQTSEQSGVAERVLQLGAGIRLKQTDAASVLQAVNLALSDPSYRENAAAISAGFQRCSGAKGAADKILSVCKK